MQYIVAIGLIHGCLEYRHYHDETASDPRVDLLREKIHLIERESYTNGFNDPKLRSDATAVQVRFVDGSSSAEVEVLFPLGDARRRDAARQVLARKFFQNTSGCLVNVNEKNFCELYYDQDRLRAMSVDSFMALLAV